MNPKAWTRGEIRKIALQTVEGKAVIATARGAYFRALIETTQADLGSGVHQQQVQLHALKGVHRRFFPVVQEATTTPDIAVPTKASIEERKRRALERNRRQNFARTAYATVKRWLRAPGHDIHTLDVKTVTKAQLLSEAAPTKKHALTKERVNARADKLIGDLIGFTRMLAKVDQVQAAAVLTEAMHQLGKQLANGAKATTDASIAVKEQRPLRIRGATFFPTPRAAA